MAAFWGQARPWQRLALGLVLPQSFSPTCNVSASRKPKPKPVGAEPYHKGVCSFKGCLPCQPYQARDGVCFADCCACTYTGRSVRVWCMNERMNKQTNELHGPPRIWKT